MCFGSKPHNLGAGSPKTLTCCSWAAVPRGYVADGVQKHEAASVEAGGDGAGAPATSAPFWGGLSENWSPEQLMD